jgi:hypothetical protein
MPLLKHRDWMEDWKVINPTKLSDWAVPPLAEEYAAMVLLVDDQVMIGEAIRRALAGQPDMDLHYCANPAEAVATAKGVKLFAARSSGCLYRRLNSGLHAS